LFVKKLLLLAVAVLISVSFLPVRKSDKPSFANPLFEQLWTEQTAAAGRLDLWGSEPLLWRVEPYADAPDGRRVVQYFDRGRMEMTPTPNGGTDVTQGLLALEITTGEIRLGSKLLQYQAPPTTSIDSGTPDSSVATYAGLSQVVQKPADDRSASHATIDSWIDAAGAVTSAPPPAPAWASQYVASTAHNLPDVFTSYFDRNPFGRSSWVEALGYPISEPYWTTYRRDGQPLPSLVQVFERRILVYTPSLPSDQQITLANVGRHYYRWRYGEDAPRELPTPMAGDSLPMLNVTVPDGFQVGVYAQHLGTPVGLAIGPSGNLWIATEQGDIVEVRSTTSGGAAGKTSTFAEGLPNPRGLAVEGDAVYVAVDDGIIRLLDRDGDGHADQQEYVSKAVEPAPASPGAPALSEDGHIYVPGRLLPDGSSRVVSVTSPAGSTTIATQSLAKPGPILVSQGRLYAVDQRPNGTSSLYEMSLLDDGTAGPTSPPIAQFSSGMTVNKVLIFNSNLWPSEPNGTIFAEVSDGSSGKIVSLKPNTDGSLPDVVDFSTGYAQPVDMAIGLDGSLYVADAANQQVLKIVATKRSGP
jgi:hypothetical protein